MAHTTQIAALKMVVLALDEVQRFGGKLPSYDEPEDGDEAEVPLATFLSWSSSTLISARRSRS